MRDGVSGGLDETRSKPPSPYRHGLAGLITRRSGAGSTSRAVRGETRPPDPADVVSVDGASFSHLAGVRPASPALFLGASQSKRQRAEWQQHASCRTEGAVEKGQIDYAGAQHRRRAALEMAIMAGGSRKASEIIAAAKAFGAFIETGECPAGAGMSEDGTERAAVPDATT